MTGMDSSACREAVGVLGPAMVAPPLRHVVRGLYAVWMLVTEAAGFLCEPVFGATRGSGLRSVRRGR